MLDLTDKVYCCSHPLMYKQDEFVLAISAALDYLCGHSQGFVCRKMDLEEKNIVEMIAKVIEEGKVFEML